MECPILLVITQRCDHSGLNCLLANLFPFKFTQKMLYYSTVCMESRTYACVSWNIHVNAYEMKSVVLCFYVQVQITVTRYLYSFFKVTEVTVISNEWITRKKGQMKYGMYLHVYIPRRIGHDHREFAQHRHIKIPHVTLNPLK